MFMKLFLALQDFVSVLPVANMSSSKHIVCGILSTNNPWSFEAMLGQTPPQKPLNHMHTGITLDEY